jgi:serine/threonine-protein kinase CLA4
MQRNPEAVLDVLKFYTNHSGPPPPNKNQALLLPQAKGVPKISLSSQSLPKLAQVGSSSDLTKSESMGEIPINSTGPVPPQKSTQGRSSLAKEFSNAVSIKDTSSPPRDDSPKVVRTMVPPNRPAIVPRPLDTIGKETGKASPTPPRTAPQPPTTRIDQSATDNSDLASPPPPPRVDKKKQQQKKNERLSRMTDAQIMERLRSIVSEGEPSKIYQKVKKIGQGASGSVYVAKNLQTKATVAIKTMDLASQPRKELIINEIYVMKESRHENIVNFLDSYLVGSSELWVVMEYMEGGSLTDVIDSNKMVEPQISCICQQTLKGLWHLHQQKIIHRDIKSDNVLLDGQGHVKISKLITIIDYFSGLWFLC